MTTSQERIFYEKKGHDAMEAHKLPGGGQLEPFRPAEGSARIQNQQLIEDVHKELKELQDKHNTAAINSELKGITRGLVQNHVLPEMKLNCGAHNTHNAFEVVGTTPNHQGFVVRVTDRSGHEIGNPLVLGTDGKLYHGERRPGKPNQIDQGTPLTISEQKTYMMLAARFSKGEHAHQAHPNESKEPKEHKNPQDPYSYYSYEHQRKNAS